jgi:hypothetical protein
MSTKTDNRIPNPVYAAAGAGDLALAQLRKLPGRAAELRHRVIAGDLDLVKLRGLAKRNAAMLLSNAQVAQEKVTAVYNELVEHGAQVVNGMPAKPARPARPAKAAAEVAVVAEVKPVRKTRAPRKQ